MIIRRHFAFSFALAASLSLAEAAPAQTTNLNAVLTTIDKVMAGVSGGVSGGPAQVWVRVVGQPAGVPSTCTWTSFSLFYVPDDSSVSRDQALSLLTTAKVTGQPVTLQFDVISTSADFYGFGYTQCVIRRIGLG
jgi:hypothetical protein